MDEELMVGFSAQELRSGPTSPEWFPSSWACYRQKLLRSGGEECMREGASRGIRGAVDSISIVKLKEL
ncbi:hypothetical protein EYF80_031289 [Liparis tanakae]|uniref:Uncharacterized protein n=1 Tax=Liparis tanakae TaxID=230148 RepID=A0A4Z2GY86_9TELE|nr:hypothetical protein EYF80_031289 [Liparis tanakae]